MSTLHFLFFTHHPLIAPVWAVAITGLLTVGVSWVTEWAALVHRWVLVRTDEAAATGAVFLLSPVVVGLSPLTVPLAAVGFASFLVGAAFWFTLCGLYAAVRLPVAGVVHLWSATGAAEWFRRRRALPRARVVQCPGK